MLLRPLPRSAPRLPFAAASVGFFVLATAGSALAQQAAPPAVDVRPNATVIETPERAIVAPGGYGAAMTSPTPVRVPAPPPAASPPMNDNEALERVRSAPGRVAVPAAEPAALQPTPGAPTSPPAAPTPSPAQPAAPAATSQAAEPIPAPQVAQAGPSTMIKELRLNETGPVRSIVVDLTGPATYQEIAADEGFRFRLSGLQPKALEKTAQSSNPFISLVTITPDGPSSAILEVDTKQAFRVLPYTLTPDRWGGHRFVLQLKTGPIASAPRANAPQTFAPQTPAATPVPAPVAVPTPAPAAPSPATSLAVEADRALAAGRTEEACSLINQNYTADSWDMRAMFVRASCLQRQGQPRAAQTLLERLLAFDPEYHRARILLADMQMAQGKTKAGIDNYRRVLSSNPPPSVAAELQRRITGDGPATAGRPATQTGSLANTSAAPGGAQGEAGSLVPPAFSVRTQ